MSNLGAQPKNTSPPADSLNGLAPPRPAKVGDVMLLAMSGTVYGQVAELTEAGAAIVELAPYKIAMIPGDGPDEWRELNPGAATGEVITGHNIKQYEEEHAD